MSKKCCYVELVGQFTSFSTRDPAIHERLGCGWGYWWGVGGHTWRPHPAIQRLGPMSRWLTAGALNFDDIGDKTTSPNPTLVRPISYDSYLCPRVSELGGWSAPFMCDVRARVRTTIKS